MLDGNFEESRCFGVMQQEKLIEKDNTENILTKKSSVQLS